MEEALIKRVMPHSIEAEQAVVGAMMMDRDAITKASEIISGEDFYQNAYGVIFDSMVELFNEGKPVDLVTLQERLKEKEVHTGEVSRKVWQLHVSNEEKGLDTRAEVEETCREGLIRERKFQVLTGGEIAVDHAAIIVQAMCILADRLLEKR